MSPGRPRKARVKLEFWRAARIFVVILALVQAAAFNTGENLLYLVGAGTASFLLLGLLLTRTTLRGLRVVRDAPHAVHRLEPFHVTVRIENRKRIFPTMSLLIGDEARAKLSRAYLPKIPARSVALVRLEHEMPKRGIHTLPGLVLSSGFPLGLFRSRLESADASSVLVYPRVTPVRSTALDLLDDSGNLPRPLDRDGDEFFALREYVPGDDIRHICWRVSARMGRFIVRELEPSAARTVIVVFDTRGAPDTPEREEQFEEAVDLAASLAMMFLDRQYTVAMVTPAAQVGLGRGHAHATKMLEMLARVEPVEYGVHGENWFASTGDLGAAAKIYVAADPARWGAPAYGRGVRIVDPREVAHA